MMNAPRGTDSRRLVGRGLLTLANLITVAASARADWNESHVFNPAWPSHARFHAAAGVGMATGLAGVSIWALWAGPDDATGRLVGAAVPVAYWGAFFPALLVPGTGVDDPGHPVGRPAGIPANLLGAAATVATAVTGWCLDRRRS
jgi:Family of unknown function (DUF6640)